MDPAATKEAGKSAPEGRRPLSEAVRLLRESARALVRFLEGQPPADGVRRQAFDLLHRELAFLRGDAAEHEPDRLWAGLILLHDDLQRMVRKHRKDRPAAARLGALGRELLGILARQGVEPLPAPRGKFDSRRQRAVRAEAAARPADDQRVVRLVRDGFRQGGRILRPQEVVILKFQEG